MKSYVHDQKNAKIAERDEIIRLLGVDFNAATISNVTVDRVISINGGEASYRTLETSDGTSIPAILLTPANIKPSAPAILYCHAHGARYDIGLNELLDGRPALMKPYAADLLALGYMVLCLEMPCFGQRSEAKEDASSKAALWQGTTLFGQMLAELKLGLDYLASQSQVDANRIATLGISMGGTHAWWLAALDKRVRAAVHMCCFADLGCLIQSGAHDGHGHYMTVPRLLNHCSTAELAGLIAPRAQLVCVGLQDWSTPSTCFDIAKQELEYAYKDAANILEFHIEPELGHQETEVMRARVLNFLETRLG